MSLAEYEVQDIDPLGALYDLDDSEPSFEEGQFFLEQFTLLCDSSEQKRTEQAKRKMKPREQVIKPKKNGRREQVRMRKQALEDMLRARPMIAEPSFSIRKMAEEIIDETFGRLLRELK
eukprot:CAMPEP_0182445748 /NCGR_PEP_ID=MMETSP1172-20130603/3768_1 /TAXON_ID=708627 /ORGANISM="Timspurckia oligopyrenoides, Strain CCMP3278" /LENGTH=118 /DNA_ID=CAMNT_0024641571 /DNA_START=749 /DNA_END=1105 /DNA_ORIENTATION=+